MGDQQGIVIEGAVLESATESDCEPCPATMIELIDPIIPSYVMYSTKLQESMFHKVVEWF